MIKMLQNWIQIKNCKNNLAAINRIQNRFCPRSTFKYVQKCSLGKYKSKPQRNTALHLIWWLQWKNIKKENKDWQGFTEIGTTVCCQWGC